MMDEGRLIYLFTKTLHTWVLIFIAPCNPGLSLLLTLDNPKEIEKNPLNRRVFAFLHPK